MNEKRLTVVNRITHDRTRPICNEDDEPFSKCDVCWTCRFFNIFTYECVLTYKDAVKAIGIGEVDRESCYFVPTKIKEPVYYRCTGWSKR